MKEYSTTQLLTQERPILKRKPENKFETVLFLPEGENRKGEGGLRTKGYFKKSYEGKPLISIVTVVYNGEKHLEQTIKSVISQDYDNVEYLIIDGGSTDGTLEIVKKYEEYIDYWVSEPDEGIYDAMNKGIKIATGEWINFMNADDWFSDNALHLVADASLRGNPQYIFGDINKVFGDGTSRVHKGDLKNWKVHAPVCHQALFVKTDVLRRLPFDRQYKIMADYNQMIQLVKEGLEYGVIDLPLANFRIGGFSTVDKMKDRERFRLQLHYFGPFWATTSFLRQTKKPIIFHMVRIVAGIKNFLKYFSKKIR